MFFMLNKVLRKHNQNGRFETLKFQFFFITSLCIDYIGKLMTLNQRDPLIYF